MQITVTDEVGNINSLEVDSEMELINLKALIEAELRIPVNQQHILLNGKLISNPVSNTLKACGIRNDDILLIRTLKTQQSASSSRGGGGGSSLNEAEMARQQINSNPQLRARLLMQQPEIEAALNDPTRFAQLHAAMQQQAQLAARQQQQQRDLSFADPFDVEAQRRIEEEIKQQNILQNRANALEHHPESFARVIMLYIPVEINGHPVKAFVDSGAQMTIMSPSCAEACNVMHLLDTAFAGMAVGVGTAKILGRIHSSMIKVGKRFLPVSLTVMEGKDVDLLFGLDMLKAHQACIDLKSNVLRIDDECIPFLPEHELPQKARDGFGKEAAAEATKAAPSTSSGGSSETPPSTLSVPASAPISASAAQYPEAAIKTLTDMGCSRQEAVNALEMTNGNVELAVGILFS